MSLGSAPGTHRAHKKAYTKTFESFSKKAKSAAKRNQCAKADKMLVAAAAWYGASASEALGSRKNTSIKALRKRMHATTKAVRKNCKCVKKA
jgi:hypothetical protein